MSQTFKEYLQTITHDAVIWLSNKAWLKAVDANGQEQATKDIVELLIAIPHQVKREAYINSVCDSITFICKQKKNAYAIYERGLKKMSADEYSLQEENKKKMEVELLPELKAKDLTRFIKIEQDEREKFKKEKQKSIFDSHGDYIEAEDDESNPWVKCPKWMNVEEVKKHGFALVHEEKNGELKRMGYYSYNPNEKTHVEITNFSITPIFHIEAGRESKFMLKISNGKDSAVIETDAKAMYSIDSMQSYIIGQGNYFIYGSKNQYMRVASKLMQEFRKCIEVKMLGWQRYGFYAFVNGIFIPGQGLKALDEWGVIEHEKQSFLVPAASAVYKKLMSSEDDPYEQDRPMAYIQSPVTMDQWASMMHRVYQQKGTVGVAYCILCIFRDIAFGIDNNFPHLYAFGEKSSGKSKWAESLISFFFHKRPMFNLNSGTDFAFFAYMGRFRNTAAGLNEFDEKTIKQEWFQSIKGVFDGESRQRGSMAMRGKVETQKVDSGLILVGQYLVTMDDNSVVTRSIIEPFSIPELTEDDKKAYNQLKDLESQGITSLATELIEHREYFKTEYRDTFNKTISEWRSMYTQSVNFNQRIMQNWAHLYTVMFLASQKVNLSCIDINEFKLYCFEKASHWCKFIRSSDTLSEFWNTLLFLAESKEITQGWDYRIETVKKVTLRSVKDETNTKDFVDPTKILYLRLNNIHKIYEQTYRSRTGKIGMTMENLLHYFTSRSYYVGPIKNVRWDRVGESKITNGYAFLYDELEMDLESSTSLPNEDFGSASYLSGKINEKPFG